jgi:hypothetical protein
LKEAEEVISVLLAAAELGDTAPVRVAKPVAGCTHVTLLAVEVRKEVE